ncbi:TetR-like C-terminal domain-containing protein [Jatrophihabitans fulvus]
MNPDLARETPRARQRRQVQNDILAIAWELLGDGGAEAVSVAAVAARLGLTAPALYRYVRDRDEMVSRLRARAADELAAAVVAATGTTPAPGTAGDPSGIVATAIRDWARSHHHAYLLLFGPAPGELPIAVAAAEARALDAIARAVGRDDPEPSAPLRAHRPRPGDGRTPRPARPPVEPTARARSLWTRVHGVVLLELTGHLRVPGDPDAVATHLAREVAAPT